MSMLAIDSLSVAYTSTAYGRTEPSGTAVCSHTLAVVCEHVNVPWAKKE